MFTKERLYLDAKIAFYNGAPILSNMEFDSLENELISLNSKVVNQVGSKIQDYDFPHSSKMYSLNKIQTFEGDATYNYAEFKKWIDSLPFPIDRLTANLKYDGNSVNLIFNDGVFVRALTRGDGRFGKDITNNIKHRVDTTVYKEYLTEGEVEIRCEAIMPQHIFDEHYKGVYTNSRNMVGGVLGMDNLPKDIADHINLIPLSGVDNKNSKLIDLSKLFEHTEMSTSFEDYASMYTKYNEMRENLEYQIDGIVLSVPLEYRKAIGFTEKAPLWAVAIKFVPDEKESTVEGVEWFVGKTGEITPVATITPVSISNTTVSNVTCFNYGFIKQNNIGKGTKVTVSKRGDIIPYIEDVFYDIENKADIPHKCPCCQSPLLIEGIHAFCVNESCVGIVTSKLEDAVKVLSIKGIGGAKLKQIAEISKVINGVEMLEYIKKYINEPSKFGYTETQEKSYNSFKKIFESVKSITTQQLILLHNYSGIGAKVSSELEKEYCKCIPNYKGLDSQIVLNESYKNELWVLMDSATSRLEALGVQIIRYVETDESDITFVEMTGSPKEFGFKTKNAWLAQFNGKVKQCSLSEGKCNILITDDLNATSSKMKKAKESGKTIMLYSDLVR